MRRFHQKEAFKVANNEPVIRFLFEEMFKQQMTQLDMAERSGIFKETLKDWRLRTMPRINDVNSALNVLGFELTVKRIKDARD